MPPASPPTLTQRVASAAAWNTLLFPVRFVVGLVASVLLFRVLTLAEYGVLTLLAGLAATIGVWSDLGIERSLPRFIPEIEQRSGRVGVARFLRRIIVLKLGIVLACLAGLVALSGPLIGYVLERERQTLAAEERQVAILQEQGAPADERAQAVAARDAQAGVITQVEQRGTLFLWAVGALVVFGALYDVFMQFLTAYFKQRAWNVITIVVTLLQPLLITAFILLGWGLSGVLLGMVLTPVLAVALAIWQAVQAGRELATTGSAATPAAAPLARRFTAYAGMSFFVQVSTWLYDLQFISFVLYGMGLPLAQVALLAFAYKFAKDYLSYVYIPFSGVLTPLLARIRGRQDPAALQETYGSLTRLFALLLIPAGTGLALLTPWLLGLLYPRYVDAAVLIYLFIAFTFAESLLSVPQNVLMVYERYWPVFVSRVVAMVSVPLVVLLVPVLGLLGAALAVGSARVAARLVTLWYVHRQLGLRLPLPFVGRVVLASGALALLLLPLLAIWPLPPGATGWAGKLGVAASLGALALVGVVAFVLALRLLGGLDERERARILGLKLPFKRLIARLI